MCAKRAHVQLYKAIVQVPFILYMEPSKEPTSFCILCNRYLSSAFSRNRHWNSQHMSASESEEMSEPEEEVEEEPQEEVEELESANEDQSSSAEEDV